MSLKEPGQESIQQGTTHFLYKTRTQISFKGIFFYHFESYKQMLFFLHLTKIRPPLRDYN